MIKRKIAVVSMLVLLTVGGFGCGKNNTQALVDNNDNEELNQKKEAQNDLEKADRENEIEKETNNQNKAAETTIDELKELLNKDIKELTNEEIEKIKNITPEQHYELLDLTEEEIYNFIDVLHGNINTQVIFAYQEGIESETYDNEHRTSTNTFEVEFKWIEENYSFETRYHNNLIKDINRLTQEHKNGDNDALFSLAYVLYELNHELNPEKAKEIRATTLSLSDIEKIRNDGEPIFDYEY